MKTSTILLVGTLLAAAPITFAKHDVQRDESACENEGDTDCVGNQDLENAIKGLEKAVSKFQDKIEFTEWDSEPVMNYLDDLYNTTKKLEAKANKNDEAKKLKKYFSDIEEIFGRVDDEIGGSIKDSQHQCKNDTSLPCETVKDVYKSFSKLEHALEHLDREI